MAALLLLFAGLAQAQEATPASSAEQSASPFQAPKQAQNTAFTVSDIRVEGLQRISAGSVFNALPITVGTEIDQSDLVNGAKVLFKTGNFDDMQLARIEEQWQLESISIV